jgi:hypothetical protein
MSDKDRPLRAEDFTAHRQLMDFAKTAFGYGTAPDFTSDPKQEDLEASCKLLAETVSRMAGERDMLIRAAQQEAADHAETRRNLEELREAWLKATAARSVQEWGKDMLPPSPNEALRRIVALELDNSALRGQFDNLLEAHRELLGQIHGYQEDSGHE